MHRGDGHRSWTSVKPQEIECLTPEKASLWIVENPQAGKEKETFSISQEAGKGVLRISAGLCDPARTTVRVLLPGDGPANGNIWAKNQATFVSFQCKSNKPAQLTFHLLQRGKTAGSFR